MSLVACRLWGGWQGGKVKGKRGATGHHCDTALLSTKHGARSTLSLPQPLPLTAPSSPLTAHRYLRTPGGSLLLVCQATMPSKA